MFQLRLDWEKTWIWQNRNLLSSFVHYMLTSSMWFLVHNSSCTRCDYSSSPSSSLKSHTMIHSGEKPFSFKQCNYSFTWSSHFKTHMLTHSGEKLNSCSHCSLSCTTAGNPKDHVRTHSGEKPFHCDQCNFTSTLTHLKRHKLKHTAAHVQNWSKYAFFVILGQILPFLAHFVQCPTKSNVNKVPRWVFGYVGYKTFDSSS